MRKAKELLFTGNMIDAEEAWRLGLVNKVVTNDKLEEEVNKLAQTVAKVPVVNNEFNKRLVNMAYDQVNIRSVMERSGELEAMSLTASAESNPERAEFQRLVREKGLKPALEWRGSRFIEEDRWWKERKSKPGKER